MTQKDVETALLGFLDSDVVDETKCLAGNVEGFLDSDVDETKCLADNVMNRPVRTEI